MDKTLREIWYDIENASYNATVDGDNIQNIWNTIKNKYFNYTLNNNIFIIKKEFIELYDKYNSDYTSLILNNKLVINIDSLISNLFTILKMDEFKLKMKNIMKLAYIVGIIRALADSENVKNDVYDWYVKHKLDNIGTYLNHQDIYTTIKEITNCDTYYQKYLKYKNKYLDLKKNLTKFV